MNAFKTRAAEILLVEDNEDDVLLTREAFNMAKISNNISVAEDGEIALQLLTGAHPERRIARPDLILLDLNLPKVDGREVLNYIKRDPDLRWIPVIVMTGSSAEIDIVKSYTLHANAYVTKPLGLDSLEKIVNALGNFWFEVVVYPETAA